MISNIGKFEHKVLKDYEDASLLSAAALAGPLATRGAALHVYVYIYTYIYIYMYIVHNTHIMLYNMVLYHTI